MDAAAKGKRAGNEAFAARDFAGALAAYRAAILAAEGAPVTDQGLLARSVLLAQLHANASAAELECRSFSDALRHAAAAVSAQPNWPKAYLRKASVLTALGKHREAFVCLKVAEALEPSAAIVAMRRRAEAAADAQDATEAITSAGRFAGVFRYIRDPRLKLATLAHAWNLLTMPERHGTLREFLRIVGGERAVDEALPAAERPAPHIANFAAADLHPLPMDNYADLTVPPTWLAFFEQLAAPLPAGAGASGALEAGAAQAGVGAPAGPPATVPPRVGLLRSLWDLCSPAEQAMIVEDMRSFYGPRPVDGGAGEEGAPGGEAGRRPSGPRPERDEWSAIRDALGRQMGPANGR